MFSRSRVSVIFLAVSIAFVGRAAAQEIVVGVKGGGNVSDLRIEESGTSVASDTESGFAGGLFVQAGLGEIFAIRPEVFFSQKGASSSDEGLFYRASLDYVEVPVLVVARMPLGGRIRPYALAGPVLSFETGCEIEIEGLNGPVASPCESFDEEDPFLTKGTDFGLSLGGGVEMMARRVVVMLDGRYTFGLTDINDIESAAESYRNRAWSFSVGVGLPVR